MLELAVPLLFAGAIAAVIMMTFVMIRDARDRRRRFWRERVIVPSEEGIRLTGLRPTPRRGISGWIDCWFEELVRGTGLGWSVSQALGWVALAGVTLAGAFLLWRGDAWLIGFGMLAGMAVPLAIFLILRARRRALLQSQLPDLLFLLARSLRAGLSLEQALENVAAHGTRPLAEEFRRGVEQVKLGLTVPAALEGIGRRLRLPDFDVFVAVVALHRNMGGNLTLLLDRVASTTRDRNLFRGHFRATTALSRITGYTLAAGAPVIFLGYALWQPDFVSRFFDSMIGVRMLIVALVLEVIGVCWVSWLLRARY